METITSPDFNPAFSAGPPGAGVTTCNQQCPLYLRPHGCSLGADFATRPAAAAVGAYTVADAQYVTTTQSPVKATDIDATACFVAQRVAAA